MIGSLLLAGACFGVSAGLTLAVRAFAVRQSILDIPNERSSHTTPTPRGGGVAIAVAALGGFVGAEALGWRLGALGIGLLTGGALIAGVGWADDRGHVPAPFRAVVHVIAAGIVLWCIGGLPEIRVGTATVTVGWGGTLFALVAIVWMINLYNFMDGIDGIAAGEATSIALLAAVLLWILGHSGLAVVTSIIAAAAAGFLLWNWSPARIFMGDAGSGLLGFLFGAIAVASERNGALPGLVWVLLLGVFIVDATATLLRRVARGERWYSAHRQHAYQRATRAGFSHGQVSGAVIVINLTLGSAALFAVYHPDREPVIVLVAYGVLLLLYAVVERMKPMVRHGGIGGEAMSE